MAKSGVVTVGHRGLPGAGCSKIGRPEAGDYRHDTDLQVGLPVILTQGSACWQSHFDWARWSSDTQAAIHPKQMINNDS